MQSRETSRKPRRNCVRDPGRETAVNKASARDTATDWLQLACISMGSGRGLILIDHTYEPDLTAFLGHGFLVS